jgi:cytidylate kinase
MHISAPTDLVEKAVKNFQNEMRRKKDRAPQSPRRVITISRQLGSGGMSIAALLKKWLGWPVWDKEILDVLAHQSHLGYQKKMFETIDEKVQDEIESMVAFMFGHRDKNAYLYLLPKAIFLIAQNDAIIVGRGAHLFLPESLKVRIKASFATRVENVARSEGITQKEAQGKIKAVDQEREAFIKEVCRRLGKPYAESKNHLHYDLEINTDILGIAGAAVLILIAAAHKFGLKIDLKEILREAHVL